MYTEVVECGWVIEDLVEVGSAHGFECDGAVSISIGIGEGDGVPSCVGKFSIGILDSLGTIDLENDRASSGKIGSIPYFLLGAGIGIRSKKELVVLRRVFWSGTSFSHTFSVDGCGMESRSVDSIDHVSVAASNSVEGWQHVRSAQGGK